MNFGISPLSPLLYLNMMLLERIFMNKIIISHRSALSLFRQIRCSKISVENYFSNNLTRTDLLKVLEKPIDIMVESKNNFCKSDIFRYHIQPKEIKRNSLIKLSDTVFCANPELVIIQMVDKLSFEQVFLLISELTGSYSLDEHNKCIETAIPNFTSVAKIQNYEKRLSISNPRYRGCRLLREALRYVADNSASSMESKLYLKLCGSRKRGYYECKNLEFNKKIKLSIAAKKIADQEYVMPDISSCKFKVAIEYDSAQYHTNILQNQKDKARRDALTHDG